MALIALADDDDILSDLVRFRLESDGHRLVTAADGARAVEMIREHKPDLVILDSMMPILTGPEVLRTIRQDPETMSIPVVMLTSRSGEADVVSALKLGANEYITKPFRPHELAARVESILRQNPGRDAR